jgi:hypothetical protein
VKLEPFLNPSMPRRPGPSVRPREDPRPPRPAYVRSSGAAGPEPPARDDRMKRGRHLMIRRGGFVVWPDEQNERAALRKLWPSPYRVFPRAFEDEPWSVSSPTRAPFPVYVFRVCVVEANRRPARAWSCSRLPERLRLERRFPRGPR